MSTQISTVAGTDSLESDFDDDRSSMTRIRVDPK
jgi:hypothetical protein